MVRPLVLKIFQSPSGMKGNGRSVERRAIYQLEVFLKLQPGSVDTSVEVSVCSRSTCGSFTLCLRLLKNIAHKVHPVENSPECAILPLLTKFLGPGSLVHIALGREPVSSASESSRPSHPRSGSLVEDRRHPSDSEVSTEVDKFDRRSLIANISKVISIIATSANSINT
jgi:hypothetical protein